MKMMTVETLLVMLRHAYQLGSVDTSVVFREMDGLTDEQVGALLDKKLRAAMAVFEGLLHDGVPKNEVTH